MHIGVPAILFYLSFWKLVCDVENFAHLTSFCTARTLNIPSDFVLVSHHAMAYFSSDPGRLEPSQCPASRRNSYLRQYGSIRLQEYSPQRLSSNSERFPPIFIFSICSSFNSIHHVHSVASTCRLTRPTKKSNPASLAHELELFYTFQIDKYFESIVHAVGHGGTGH